MSDGVIWIGIALIAAFFLADVSDFIRKKDRGISALAIICAFVVYIMIASQG